MIADIRRQSGYYVLLAVVVVLFFAASMLLLSRSKDNVERLSQQSGGAPGGLGKIEIALRNFVFAQKRLPCPADPTDASGKEPSGSTTSCSKPDGVVPWGSIGLSAADALDPWNRRVSYRVYDGANGFTQTAGLDASNCNTSSALTVGAALTASGACAHPYHESRYADFLTGKGISVNDRGSMVSNVGYVLISHGASGNGSYGPFSPETPSINSTRSTLPNAASKEYPNTQALGTYWKQDASASTVLPGDATHFDDVVFYKRASELLDEAKLAGRDWGTVSVDKSFSPTSVTVGASTSFTITLTSTIVGNAQLAKSLVETFPTGWLITGFAVVANPCQGVAAVGATTNVLTLPAGLQIPGAASPSHGVCTVSVTVSPGAAGGPYSDPAFTKGDLEVTPNLSAVAPVAGDTAQIRNLNTSSAFTLQATAAPPPTVDNTFNRSTVAAATGTTISTNDTGFNSITFSAVTVSAFADPPNLRNVSAAAGGGIGAIVPGGGGTSLSTSNNEGLRFVFNADYRYLGVTLLNFNTGAGSAKEQVMMTFYDASGTQVGTPIIKQSCRTSPTITNFTFDPGANYRRVDIQARTVSNSGTSSVFLLGGITACATGSAATCTVSGASPANDCP